MNQKYTIKYSYQTGNSFASEAAEGTLREDGFEWENLDVVKANLQRIQEHYKQYNEIENDRSYKNTRQELLAKNADKDWFVAKKRPVAYEKDGMYYAIDANKISKLQAAGVKTGSIYDESTAQNCILLYLDNGNPVQIWAPWCGYFERLYDCEIVAVGPDETGMSFSV